MSSATPSNNKGAIGAAVGAIGAIALAPVLVPAALGIIGFGSAGVIGGSIAAGVQAGIGNVAAGSLFAVAQSIGAGGAIPAAVYAAAGAMGAAAGARATHPDDSDESCYICGSEKHKGDRCLETTNGFLTKDNDGNWRGPEKEAVCIDFNKRSGCRRENCNLAHMCTRCGSQHNAQNHGRITIVPPSSAS